MSGWEGAQGTVGGFLRSSQCLLLPFQTLAEVEVRRELAGLANEVAVTSKVCAPDSHWEGGSRPLDLPLCTGKPSGAGTEGAGQRTPGGPPHLGLRVVEATDSPVRSQAWQSSALRARGPAHPVPTPGGGCSCVHHAAGEAGS